MKNFVKISQQLVGKKYALGTVDCFSLILMYFDLVGFEYPDEFNGHTKESYKDLYLEEPDAAKELMVEFIDSVCETIEPHKAKSGDILLLQVEDIIPALGIKGGNSTVIVATEEFGVRVFPTRAFKLLRGWRWHRQYL